MLKRAFVLLVICTVVLAVPALGAQQQQTGTPVPKPAEAQAAPAPAAAPTPAPTPRAYGQPITVRIDLTVSDQIGAATPAKKVMTMLAADGERASVRSVNRALGQNAAQFSVDARPMLTQDKIRLDLSIVYEAPEISLPAGEKQIVWSTNVQESMGIVVQNGVATIVSQSADPRTDRKVSVEVKATIVK